jgi:1,4-alpha-glucan branching enzyme
MKRLLLLLTATCCGAFSYAQLLTWTPSFPTEDNSSQTLVITVDASKGNQGLLNHTPTSDIYIHTGVITNLSTSSSNWRYVKFSQNFNQPNPQLQAVSLGNNKWQFTIAGSLKAYYGVPAGETIQKIALLFRSGDGSKVQRNTDGSDMYIPVYTSALAVRLSQPPSEPKFIPTPEPQTWTTGTSFPIAADANKPSAMKLYHNGAVIATSAGNVTTLSGTSTILAAGNQQVVAEANDGTTIKYDTLNIFVAVSPVLPLPPGAGDGINYNPNNTSVTLVLRAPGKGIATVIGDFNNWTQAAPYIMNKTQDGKYFWLTINGLTPGTEYGFQYVVDGTVKIADPYAEKLLDPFNDGFISSSTYPNLKPYPAGQSGIVSVLQTQQPTYNWGVTNFTKQDKRGLVIYELLVRDFIAAHDWKTLKDTLSYLKRLGINAIEIMPWTEFEGNSSWGYNTYQYFAPDKYYGPKNTLKEFIDTCHKNGIAVIMDIVLNHTYGPSPLARLYWDAQNNRPAANNPWYNAIQPHAFGFGEDFNHESADTKYFFNRVLQHWINEYKVDGYRVDFSKGLTQKPSSNDAAFSAYDATRIAIINGYANTIKAADPNSYIILEHFADNAEEKELADNNGLLLWANVWTQYQEASMGYIANSNFDGGVHTTKGWANAHLVTFMESHDEERITYKNIKYGNAAGSYTIKDTATALKRMELNAAFLLTIPGPKMIWQFGELGYDYSRCYLSTNGEGGDCDKKLDPKPIRWDYKAEERRKRVFDVYSQLNKLRFHQWYRGVFQSSTIERSLSGAFKWIKLTTANDTSDVMVIGNFDVVPQTGTVTFPTAGTWYDYLGNFIHASTGAAQSFTLQPGEFHVYVNRNVNNLTTTPVSNLPWNGTTLEAKVYPNPVSANYTVEIKLPQSSTTRIDLYNNIGQYITTVYNGFLTTGTKTIPLAAPGLSKGTYFLKLQVKGSTKTISLTLQ